MTTSSTAEEARTRSPHGAGTPKPSGIGLAVAYAWALAAQMFSMVVLAVGFNLFPPAGGERLPTAVIVLGLLIAGGICVAWGEAIRAGNRAVYWFQVGLSILLTLTGYVYQLPLMIRGASQGSYWSFIPGFVLIVVTPFLLYRLLQPGTRAWFATVTPAESRARHGGVRWLLPTIIGAAIGGLLVALATTHP